MYHHNNIDEVMAGFVVRELDEAMRRVGNEQGLVETAPIFAGFSSLNWWRYPGSSGK